MLALSLLLTAPGCQNVRYGQGTCDVELTTFQQQQALPGATPQPATAYVLDLDAWDALGGDEPFNRLEILSKTDERQAAELQSRLLTSLVKYRVKSGTTPVIVTLPARRHIFVAECGGKLRFIEFDAIKKRGKQVVLDVS